MLASMTDAEREELQRSRFKAEKLRRIDSLVDEYEINKSITDTARRLATRYGGYVRDAIEEDDEQSVRQLVDDIKLCKQVIECMAQDQRRIRKEIKEVRGHIDGTQGSRR